MIQFSCPGLRLAVTGVSHVKWTEGGGRSSVTYQGESNVFNAVNYFFGKENGEPIEVSAGVHHYKFACRIPKNAPGSVEGKFGYIRYKAAVNLEIPYMPDMNSEVPFTVVRYEDLNMYPELKIANEVEEVKTFCCFICETDPVMVKISTQQSGYVAGDKIAVSVELFNRSSVEFIKSMISLNRVETFYSFSPLEKSKKFSMPVTAIFGKGVAAKKNNKFQEVLQVPQNLAVSNDRFCDVFQITYEIKFFMKPNQKSSHVEATVPICKKILRKYTC